MHHQSYKTIALIIMGSTLLSHCKAACIPLASNTASYVFFTKKDPTTPNHYPVDAELLEPMNMANEPHQPLARYLQNHLSDAQKQQGEAPFYRFDYNYKPIWALKRQHYKEQQPYIVLPNEADRIYYGHFDVGNTNSIPQIYAWWVLEKDQSPLKRLTPTTQKGQDFFFDEEGEQTKLSSQEALTSILACYLSSHIANTPAKKRHFYTFDVTIHPEAGGESRLAHALALPKSSPYSQWLNNGNNVYYHIKHKALYCQPTQPIPDVHVSGLIDQDMIKNYTFLQLIAVNKSEEIYEKVTPFLYVHQHKKAVCSYSTLQYKLCQKIYADAAKGIPLQHKYTFFIDYSIPYKDAETGKTKFTHANLTIMAVKKNYPMESSNYATSVNKQNHKAPSHRLSKSSEILAAFIIVALLLIYIKRKQLIQHLMHIVTTWRQLIHSQ